MSVARKYSLICAPAIAGGLLLGLFIFWFNHGLWPVTIEMLFPWITIVVAAAASLAFHWVFSRGRHEGVSKLHWVAECLGIVLCAMFGTLICITAIWFIYFSVVVLGMN